MNGARISACSKYRYALWRTISPDVDEGLAIGYIGVNPSTADATIDDQTVMKWRGFTKLMGGHKFAVVNLFAYRSTDVNELKYCEDPIGADNDKWIDWLIQRCDVIVPCWGNSSKLPKSLRFRAADVTEKLSASSKPVNCFGKTLNGDPKHPLMLGYKTTEIVPFFEGVPSKCN